MFAHEIRSQIQPKAASIMNQATSRRRKAPPIDLAEARRSGQEGERETGHGRG